MPEVEPWKVSIYARRDQSEPYTEWERDLDRADKKAAARVRAQIARIRLGNLGDCEPVGGGAFELKLDCGPGYRIYFGEMARRHALLLLGGSKGRQPQDIKKAQEHWVEYKERGDAE